MITSTFQKFHQVESVDLNILTQLDCIVASLYNYHVSHFTGNAVLTIQPRAIPQQLYRHRCCRNPNISDSGFSILRRTKFISNNLVIVLLTLFPTYGGVGPMKPYPCVSFTISQSALDFLEDHFGSVLAFDTAFEDYQIPIQAFFARSQDHPIDLVLITKSFPPVGLTFIKSMESWVIQDAFSVSEPRLLSRLSA